MKAKRTARWLSGSLAFALALQMGTANAFAAVLPDYAETMTETSVTAADPDEAKQAQLAAELGANGNPVTPYTNVHDGERKVILWTKGITPPEIGKDLLPYSAIEGGKTVQGYKAEWKPGMNWYDVNKSGGSQDFYLCFASAASASLHWWLDQNSRYIERYRQELAKQQPQNTELLNAIDEVQKFTYSVTDKKTHSDIFEYFIKTFGGNKDGYFVYRLHDHFINGYEYTGSGTPQFGSQGDLHYGFFHPVFGSQRLAQRSRAGSYYLASSTIKNALMEGKMILPTYKVGTTNHHVITLWGAEFDLNGNLCGIFVTDSDDNSPANLSDGRNMFRYTFYESSDGNAAFTEFANPDASSNLFFTDLDTLSLGTEYWQQYFGEVQTPLTLTWSNTTFTYDGQSHAPAAELPASVQGDVKIVVEGAATDAGNHTATAKLTGADAGKYTLKNATQVFTITPAATTVTLTSTKADGQITLHAEVGGNIGSDALTGTVTFSDGSNTIGTVDVNNGVAETQWTAPVDGKHTITATFTSTNNNYSGSTGTREIDLSKKEQAKLTIDPIGDKTFKTDTTFALSAKGGSTNEPIQYTSSNQSVITISGSTATIVGAGTTTITATMPGNDTYSDVSATVEVTVNKAAAPEINFPTASPLTYGKKLSESTLTGGSVDLGTFAWANAETVPGVGTAGHAVIFTPSDTTKQNYEKIPDEKLTGEVSVTVEKAASTVTLNASHDDSGNITLTASISKAGYGEAANNGTVTFLYEKDGAYVQIPGAAPATVQDGKAQFVWNGLEPGTYSFKAQFNGSTNYIGADSAEVALDTTKPAPQAHTVTVTTVGSGTASADSASAVQGTTVTLTAAPAEGYIFKGWNVVSGGVTISADNSFTMPDMDVEIQAVFEKEETPQPPQPPVPPTPPQPPVPPYVPPMPPQPNVPNIVTNPDGSTTETVRQPDGSVVKETSKPDGSRVVEYTKNDGSTSVTYTTADGRTEAQVKIPERVTGEAAKNGQTVALPMPPVSVQNGRPSSVTVDLGTAQDITISVPVDRLAPGVVAVTVKPDGTKEVVRKSVVKENGLVLTVDGKTTLEIQDNTKFFEDTNGHWASDAITFVTSHEIYNGTSATTFSPNEGITRGMLVKVLHNLEGSPMANASNVFVDVSSDAWFAEPVHWAVNSGIVTGVSGDAFAPNKQITREDIAVMLYRYAGSPQVNNLSLSFRDADQVSAYAETAICWAVENGIMSGTDAATLDPKGTATRAQAAVMLMRMMDVIMG